MSIETMKLEKGLCRCCHNDGRYKNLGETWVEVEGQEVAYVDMLQQCLNIDLSPVPGPLCSITFMICEECILRLRDVCNFRQQVVLCEKRFQELYGKNVIKLVTNYEVEVKLETPDNEDQDVKPPLSPQTDDADDFGLDYDDGADDDFEIGLKEETKKPKTKKSKAKAKVKAKPKARGRPRKLDAKAADDGEEKEKTSVLASLLSSTPKFRLRETDYITEGDVYKCTKCDKLYDKLSSLRYHVKTKHYNIPRYLCSYCPEGFMTPAPLTAHKLKEHNVDDRFKCNACKGAFNTKVQLRKHINNFHMLGEKYKCEFCEYESFSFEGLYKHKFKHKTVKDYHCRFCRKAFLRKTTLDLHERIHTGDRRKVCSVCSKAFVQKASLNYHMTKYHPEVNF